MVRTDFLQWKKNKTGETKSNNLSKTFGIRCGDGLMAPSYYTTQSHFYNGRRYAKVGKTHKHLLNADGGDGRARVYLHAGPAPNNVETSDGP